MSLKVIMPKLSTAQRAKLLGQTALAKIDAGVNRALKFRHPLLNRIDNLAQRALSSKHPVLTKLDQALPQLTDDIHSQGLIAAMAGNLNIKNAASVMPTDCQMAAENVTGSAPFEDQVDNVVALINDLKAHEAKNAKAKAKARSAKSSRLPWIKTTLGSLVIGSAATLLPGKAMLTALLQLPLDLGPLLAYGITAAGYSLFLLAVSLAVIAFSRWRTKRKYSAVNKKYIQTQEKIRGLINHRDQKRALIVTLRSYSESTNEEARKLVPFVLSLFSDANVKNNLKSMIDEFEITPEEKDLAREIGKKEFDASSPDEKAMVEAAVALQFLKKLENKVELCPDEPDAQELSRIIQDKKLELQFVVDTIQGQLGFECLSGAHGGQYKVTNQHIGTGGMGSVWKGINTKTGEPVCIKYLSIESAEKTAKESNITDPDTIKLFIISMLIRFAREFNIGYELNHPHIARAFDSNISKVVDLGELNQLFNADLESGIKKKIQSKILDDFDLEKMRHETIFSAFEYIPVLENSQKPAGDMANYYGSAMSPVELLDIIIPLADALAYAHEQGKYHRDIKLSNILLAIRDNEPFAIWIDFGIGKEEGTREDLTQDWQVGTPKHYAPITYTDKAKENIKNTYLVDLYQFGIILYELSVGHSPFADMQAPLDYLKFILENPEKLTDEIKLAPPELQPILAKLLDPDPAQNYADTRALITDLEKARKVLAEKVQNPPAPRGPQKANEAAQEKDPQILQKSIILDEEVLPVKEVKSGAVVPLDPPGEPSSLDVDVEDLEGEPPFDLNDKSSVKKYIAEANIRLLSETSAADTIDAINDNLLIILKRYPEDQSIQTQVGAILQIISNMILQQQGEA